jgi:Fe-S-cluster containining protein
VPGASSVTLPIKSGVTENKNGRAKLNPMDQPSLFTSADAIRDDLSAEERAYYREIFAVAKESARDTLAALRSTTDPDERTKQMALLAHLPHEGMEGDLYTVFNSGDDSRAALDSIACAKGCHFCCHVNVMVSIPEAFLIASGIRFEERTELENAVKATAAKIAGLTPRARHATATPCPLLEDDGACGIHELRPNACRAYFSPDADLCAASLESARAGAATKVPTLAFPHQIAAAYFSAVTEACAEAGLQNCGVEMTAALDLIFRDASAMARWLKGEAVFAAYVKD